MTENHYRILQFSEKRSCLNLGIINDLMQTRQEVAYNRSLCILCHKILVRILEWGDSYRKPCWPVLENCILRKSRCCENVLTCYENREWSKKKRRIKWRKLKGISNISSKLKYVCHKKFCWTKYATMELLFTFFL